MKKILLIVLTLGLLLGSGISPAYAKDNTYQAKSKEEATTLFTQFSDSIWSQIKDLQLKGNDIEADNILQNWRAAKHQLLESLAEIPTSQVETTAAANQLCLIFTYNPDEYLLNIKIGSPIAELKSLTLAGAIPKLSPGGVPFDLSNLDVTGLDEKGNLFDLTSSNLIWSVTSSNSCAGYDPEANSLVPVGIGSGSVTVAVGDIISNSIDFDVKTTAPELTSVNIEGTIPDLTLNSEPFALNNLSVKGLDQDGNPYDLTGLPMIWEISSEDLCANLDPDTNNLIPVCIGSGNVTVAVGDIISNSIDFDVKTTAPELTSVNIEGTIPDLTLDSEPFALNNLSVKGLDQDGNPYDLTGLPMIWEISSEDLCANLDPDTNNLIPVCIGSGNVTVAVGDIISNSIDFDVKTTAPELTSINIEGTIPDLTLDSDPFALNNLTVIGLDQDGTPYDLTGLPLKWEVNSEHLCANVDADSYSLMPINIGIGNVFVTIGGISSNSLSFSVI